MERLRTALIAVLVTVAIATGMAVAGGMTSAAEVIMADPAGKMLVAKVDGKEVTFNVSDKAAQTLAALKPGDKVTISYDESGGQRTAEAIEKATQ
jgi:Cu/Ag efflux protein CusF